MSEEGVFAERFEVRRVAGAGGMSTVYFAHDRLTGRPVALKLLRSASRVPTPTPFPPSVSETEEPGPAERARFAREARVLAELGHPHIVAYVDHGRADGGARYLAMEWLDGEDLSEHLRRTRMTIQDAVTLARGVASALAFAHQRGVLHRDIKPGNLFLPYGRASEVKVLDFGVARFQAASELTVTGTRVGTPAYMAPEQTRGTVELDPRIDMFSLGCVLFECLTGQKAFSAPTPMGLIARILFEQPARVSELRPGVPPALDDLVHRMLAKIATDRPSSTEVLITLEALGPLEENAGGPSGPIVALGEAERRLTSVVVAHEILDRVATGELGSIVEAFGGELEIMHDGLLVAVLSGEGAATDLARRAARCALAMHGVVPGSSFALATGRDEQAVRAPGDGGGIGAIIDRAMRLLPAQPVDESRRTEATDQTADTQATSRVRVTVLDVAPAVRVDEVTAGLLDTRFLLKFEGVGHRLDGVLDQAPEARRLLGKPTVCIARDAELATLVATFQAASEEPGSRGVLVTAPAGVGKSRLVHELLLRLLDGGSPFEMLKGHGDPVSAGTPLGPLAVAIRSAAGIADGEPLAARRTKLRARVAATVADAEETSRISEFLGEMIGTPFDDADRVQLRAARHDPMLLGDQMRRAWTDWLAAECRRRPVLLLLDDLHWGDLPTVTFVDSALRQLADRPFMVVALARPEVEDTFPRLWSGRDVQHIRLKELSARASKRLVSQALPAASDDTVDRIVERASGNAFYLEELVRSSAEGGDGGEAPETVLAMVQARLERMEPEARRVLRAASVFGRVFWREGVVALLGGQASAPEVARWLGTLAEREVLVPRPQSRLTNQHEFEFRHALVRDAAYAMLTANDRKLGHALAGGWLENAGEAEPVALADHFQRGAEPGRALRWYQRAAEQALAGNDLVAVLARARAGAACGGTGETLGALRLLMAEAHNWRGEFADAEKSAVEAMRFLPRGEPAWLAAMGEAALAAGVQGKVDLLRELAAQLSPDGGVASTLAGSRLSEQLIITGELAQADRLIAKLRQVGADFGDKHPDVMGRVHACLALRARFSGDVDGNMRHVEEAVASFERAGDLRNACTKRERAGYARLDLGSYEEAEAMLREALACASRLGLVNVAATARHNLGLALSRLGHHDEASEVERAAAEAFAASGNRRMEGASYEYLSLIRLAAGDAASAEAAARLALDRAVRPTLLPLNEAESLAILAMAELAQGRAEAAFDSAHEALDRLEALGGIDDGEAMIRLVYAESLAAVGRKEEARTAIIAAAHRLGERATRITSDAWRICFLEKVPENARTMELARAWS